MWPHRIGSFAKLRIGRRNCLTLSLLRELAGPIANSAVAVQLRVPLSTNLPIPKGGVFYTVLVEKAQGAGREDKSSQG
jgi:hypothetical protein